MFLKGDDADGSATETVFLALCPDSDAARQITRLAWHLRAKHQLRAMPLPERRLHVTLLRIPEHHRSDKDAVAQIAETMATISMRSFKVGFDRVQLFRGEQKRPLVLVGGDQVAGVRLLQRELATALHGCGAPNRGRLQFNPHLTLLYDDGPEIDEPLEEVGWVVRGIVLVRSLRGYGRHIPLARWSLPPCTCPSHSEH